MKPELTYKKKYKRDRVNAVVAFITMLVIPFIDTILGIPMEAWERKLNIIASVVYLFLSIYYTRRAMTARRRIPLDDFLKDNPNESPTYR